MSDSGGAEAAATLPQEKSGAARPAVLRADRVERVFIDGARELRVLDGVSLSLHAGEVVALLGRSGSGKSTLLHLLGLLDRPDGGEILVDGTPAGNLSEKDRSFLRNHHIGFVFQHYFLLPEFSVLENILMPAKVACSTTEWFGKKAAYMQRAEELIALVKLENQAGQSPRTLSGGERQRVALARSMLLQPKILLCDEPTGNLDAETGAQIVELIFSASRQHHAAVLIVTHDQTLAARADRRLRLDLGGLSEA